MKKKPNKMNEKAKRDAAIEKIVALLKENNLTLKVEHQIHIVPRTKE